MGSRRCSGAVRPPEPVIGLEIHARLATTTKLFCGCPNRFGGPPNTRVCPICYGLPGALPSPNREAVRLAVRLALALGAEVRRVSAWSRKSYFYPDLPKGYQITQHHEPLATGGRLRIEPPPRFVALRELHLEEDAGRTVRFSDGASGIDFNRCGVPLVEIVTEPELRSPEEARRFLERLRATLVATGVSDAEMEKGSLRCDANVSLRGAGERVEIKNLNSFRNVRRALAYEIERQRALAARGGTVARETRAWDAGSRRTVPLRGKEHEFDYRYLPEPDLPPLRLDAALLRAAARDLPPPVHERFDRYVAAGVPEALARDLAHRPRLAERFDRVVAAGVESRAAANWLLSELPALFGDTGAPLERLSGELLANVIGRVGRGEISHAQARRLLEAAATTGQVPQPLLDEFAAWREPQRLESLCREVLAERPGLVRRFRDGKSGLLDHFVGLVMGRTRGHADPGRVRALLARMLAGEGGP